MVRRNPVIVKVAVGFVVRWLDRVAVLALLAMMLITTSDVVLRKFVNTFSRPADSLH